MGHDFQQVFALPRAWTTSLGIRRRVALSVTNSPQKALQSILALRQNLRQGRAKLPDDTVHGFRRRERIVQSLSPPSKSHGARENMIERARIKSDQRL